MKTKTIQLLGILTASFATLRKEGKFARSLLWQYSRFEIFHQIYAEAQSLVSKFVRIALVGVFLSFFQESAVIEWIKLHWLMTAVAVVTYMSFGRIIAVFATSARENGRNHIELKLWKLVWRKNESVGIGTRVSSKFRQKLRTARRCGSYDIEQVGLWPVTTLSSVLSSIALLGTLAFLNWRICVIFAFTATVTAFVAAYTVRWVREQEKALQEQDELANEYYPASLSMDSTYLGTSRALFARASSLRKELMINKTRFHRKALLITAIVSSCTGVALAVQLFLTREGLFRDASLVQIGITVSTAAMAVGAFASAISSLFGEQNSIEDVRELLEFLDHIDGEAENNDAAFPMADQDRVRVIGADFRYPYVDNAPLVIRDISLEFVPGEAVAIVGANGSGKSTLVSLLSNVHRPQKGCILYGNTPIGAYTARSVLEHVLVIPQTGKLFDLRLSESMFGLSDMSGIDMARYSKAIAMCGAKDVLDKLPNGVLTQMGTGYTGGAEVSGGESQRLRLAGFLYKALDPRIRVVIADEPSRYLDAETRNRVYVELVSLARDHGKIVIVVSHDAELERFDRVIMLERGMVAIDSRGDDMTKTVQVVSKRLAGDIVHSGD